MTKWGRKRSNKKYKQSKKGQLAARKSYLKTKYGITLEQHKDMYISQNGCCSICEFPVSYEDIKTDHNHKTGKVRSLLCQRCNIFVGYVEATPELVEIIFEYIKIIGDRNARGR
jgi:hypothetical protein